jgi:hypothetical protein
MTNTIRLLLSIHKPDTEIAKDAVAAYDGLKDNPNFVNPPVPLDVFKAAIDNYASKIAAADDGGRKAIIDRNKQRETVNKMMYQLGHWVVANCKDDPWDLSIQRFPRKIHDQNRARAFAPTHDRETGEWGFFGADSGQTEGDSQRDPL